MAKQPKTLDEKAPKKRVISLRDLSPRKETEGGAAKEAKLGESSTIPGSLEEFLGRNSLHIEP